MLTIYISIRKVIGDFEDIAKDRLVKQLRYLHFKDDIRPTDMYWPFEMLVLKSSRKMHDIYRYEL